jgi:hypothetical protein
MKRWSHPPGLNRRPADYEAEYQPASYSFLVANWPLFAAWRVHFGGFCMGICMGKNKPGVRP